VLGAQVEPGVRPMQRLGRPPDQRGAALLRQRRAVGIAAGSERGSDAQLFRREREGRVRGDDEAEQLTLDDRAEFLERPRRHAGQAAHQRLELSHIGRRVAFTEIARKPRRAADEGLDGQSLDQLLGCSRRQPALIEAMQQRRRQLLDRVGERIDVALPGQLCQLARQPLLEPRWILGRRLGKDSQRRRQQRPGRNHRHLVRFMLARTYGLQTRHRPPRKARSTLPSVLPRPRHC
jgi:hypothetical protein